MRAVVRCPEQSDAIASAISPLVTLPHSARRCQALKYSINVRLAGGAALATRALIEFHDDTGMIDEAEIDFAATGQNKIVSTIQEVTLGAPTVLLRIRFATGSAGNGVIASHARISAQGAYE